MNSEEYLMSAIRKYEFLKHIENEKEVLKLLEDRPSNSQGKKWAVENKRKEISLLENIINA